MSDEIYINRLGVDLSDLYENEENEVPTLDSNSRRRKPGPVEQEKRRQKQEPDPEDDEEQQLEDEENPQEKEEKEELSEEELQKIENERKKCIRAINKYRIRVPHLLVGHQLKEMSIYQQMSLKDLQDEIEIIQMTTRSNTIPNVGRKGHNVLWQGIEWAGIKAKYNVVGISEIPKLDESPRNLKEQMADIVDLIDIEYGPDAPNLWMVYIMQSINIFTNYHKQKTEAMEKRGESAVEMSEASKLIPMDLQDEALRLLN